MLKVEQLNLKSPYLQLLTSVSFTLHKGEILGVIGASGSGKSMLAQALLGQLPNGFSLEGNIEYTQPLRCALAAQSSSVLDPLRRISQQLHNALLRSNKQSSPSLPITSNISQSFPHQLSGGMTKHALLALACWQLSDVIIVDEPCCGLDFDAAEKTYGHLTHLARTEQTGVMIISHNLRQLLKVADRILVLQEGHVIEETTPENIYTGTCHAYTKRLWQALPENWGVDHVDAA